MLQPHPAELRQEVERAVLAAVEEAGGFAIDRAAIVAAFAPRGVARSTAFRWIAAALESGTAAAQLAKVPAADATAAGPAPIGALAKISAAITACEQVMAYARTPEGVPRAPKLLLAAADNLRRCLETAARLSKDARDAASVERFHAAIFEEIGQEAPEVVARIVARLGAVAGRFGA
jgi:hypothetical protein